MDVPTALLTLQTDLASLGHYRHEWFYKADPFSVTFTIAIVLAVITWLLGLVTGNVSHVDRLWSLLPPFYSWLLYFLGEKHPRTLALCIFSTIWGARLTYNFARKGGYNFAAEDYRWEVVRKRMTRWQFELLHLVFIAFIQHVLLWGIALPVYLTSVTPLQPEDVYVWVLLAVLLLGESIADQQQWRFQQSKAARQLSSTELTRGFITSGLWKFSRHPNFFCEISIWWAVYLSSVVAAGWNWTVWGCVSLTLLFQGSTTLTEQITTSKYPMYGAYQRTTSRLIPWFPARKTK
eukprot:TRINITY_DN3958_c0_g1_i1.p1 TRINITY_DN3958_c0_g1~~TRINITY_DN3958_c0_g1_i1.p1  ORF type:complete len:292 (-),score=18.82 TRINITY_DN3958_c0_g1_i1:61-936(-)